MNKYLIKDIDVDINLECDAGQVHVNWGGGSSLALNPEIDDYYLY